jgi:hypothetical protein
MFDSTARRLRQIRILPAGVIPTPGRPVSISDLRWSPDGSRLMMQVWQFDLECRGGYVVHARFVVVPVPGGSPATVAEAFYPGRGIWDPSGRRIAFADQWGLHVVTVRTRRERTFAGFTSNLADSAVWTTRGIYGLRWRDPTWRLALLEPDRRRTRGVASVDEGAEIRAATRDGRAVAVSLFTRGGMRITIFGGGRGRPLALTLRPPAGFRPPDDLDLRDFQLVLR